MEFSEILRRRRSVRSYRADPVPSETIDRLIDIARRAPTAGFSQGLDFLVLDEPESVARFWELTGDPAGTALEDGGVRPPVVVMVFSDPLRYLARYSEEDKAAYGLQDAEEWPTRFWDTDAGMASMLLLLAAVDAGLGAWFFGISEGAEEVRGEFGVPEDRNLVGVVGLGRPNDDEVRIGSGVSRKRRPLQEQLHRNGW